MHTSRLRPPSTPPRTILVLTVAAIVALAHVADAQQRGRAPASPSDSRPRLLVLLVADQFRGDYSRRYGHHWTKGLRRLFEEGAVFPLGRYPYTYTVTCPGHATISTGAPPSVHGLIGNDWLDRATGRWVACTNDPAARPVGLAGVEGTERHSLRMLRATTLADELRRQRPSPGPRIAAVSLKPRSALTFAGQPSSSTTAVYEEDNGTWATSAGYASPPASVDDYVRAHPVTSFYGTRWPRLLPERVYLHADDVETEPTPRVFPHVLDSASGRPDNSYVTRWERSPFSDEYILEIALRLLDDLELGRRDATDLLAISFSALDLVGHRFGPDSHEVQDVLARLDVLVGRLLAALDQRVGRGRYVLGFSADHGVAPVPELAAAGGLPAGRYSSTAVRRAAEGALAGVWGIGTYVQGASGTSVYLHEGVLSRIAATDGAARRLEDALLAVPGVARVIWSAELTSSTPPRDDVVAAARLSYVPGRSGDIVILPKPYWMAQSTGTTHGTPYLYDQQVPLVLIGAGIRPGRYHVPATPLDLAPTLAQLAGITMPQATGRPLTVALR
jgi:predicted AlkP superfamily pyrophosphatase or phosphodiesterase